MMDLIKFTEMCRTLEVKGWGHGVQFESYDETYDDHDEGLGDGSISICLTDKEVEDLHSVLGHWLQDRGAVGGEE